MDLMNKELSVLTEDMGFKPVTVFRQDPKLVAAIDKLFCGDRHEKFHSLVRGPVKLPDRKLEFDEVQQLLKLTSKEDAFLKRNEARKSLIRKIEVILSNVNKSAESGETPKMVIRNQRLWSNCIYDLDRVTLKSFNEAKKSTITYSSTEDKTRFNIIVFVLTKVHELLLKNLIVTRRELFYQNVTRFRNQTNLDIAVRDVCCLLESPPWCLGIVATAKGLIAGPLTMRYRDGTVIDCTTLGGTLIPQDVEGIQEFKSSAKYIFVLEKDAIFQKLLDEGALVRLGPVIIITGKGYPDVCTRQLLCRLCNELHLKAIALVDADPHGFEIFLTYKYGSLAQSHLSSSLACTSLMLLGASVQDVMTLSSSEARLKLTNLDKRKLAALLKRPYLQTETGARLKQEVNAMLSSGIKAEIEAVATTAAALCDAYLPSKIIQGDYLG
ncbi:meiotic recombination protein SPO11 [Achroia grisella]|uniref:meiotic recombination protein SPO11 n=1 Tax=Achroia grisella TaxID=688607 RepID=UPI0027D21866|nr:meiotic recombination protein SPO11 [Achroia grisella]